MRLDLKVTFVSRRIKLIKAAKLMPLSSVKLIGKLRENKIRKDEKRKRHFMILTKVAQFLSNLEQKRASTLLLKTILLKAHAFICLMPLWNLMRQN